MSQRTPVLVVHYVIVGFGRMKKYIENESMIKYNYLLLLYNSIWMHRQMLFSIMYLFVATSHFFNSISHIEFKTFLFNHYYCLLFVYVIIAVVGCSPFYVSDVRRVLTIR